MGLHSGILSMENSQLLAKSTVGDSVVQISRVFVPELLTALKADSLIQKLQVIYRLMYLTNKRRQKLSLKSLYIYKYKWAPKFCSEVKTKYCSNLVMPNGNHKHHALKHCVISHFRHEVAENYALLGYYASSSGNFLPKFWDNLSIPSSGFKNRILLDFYRHFRTTSTLGVQSFWILEP